MGITLKDLVKLSNKEINIITAINVGIDLVNQIQIIHDSNILHCGIKDSNICYGNLSLEGKYFNRTMGYLDFGNSLIFKNNKKF